MANEGFAQTGGIEDAQRLSVGKIIKTSSFKNYIKRGDGGWTEFGHSAEKGQVFVLALLGIEPKDGSKEVDIQKAMNSIGWVNLAGRDWVEAAQFLLLMRRWPSEESGDARDLQRQLLNLTDYGFSDEERDKLIALIEFPKDTKHQAWEKVYVAFKKMYWEAMSLKPWEKPVPDFSPPKTAKAKAKKKGR